MPDLNELRATVVVDTSGLEKLSSASETTTQAIQRQTAAFTAQGLSAEEAKAALASLGYTSEAVSKALGTVTVATTSLDRAMTTAASRIAVTELGLGRMGLALSRVGIASGVLGPALSAAFPVIAIIGVISLLDTAAEKIEKLRDRVVDADLAWQGVDHSVISFNDHLTKELAEADVRLEHFTKIGMGEFDASIRTATVDVDSLFNHIKSVLSEFVEMETKTSKGIFMQFLTGQGGTEEVKSAAKKAQDEIQAALLQGDTAGAQAAVARALDAIIVRENELKSISGSADRLKAYEQLRTVLDGYNKSLALSVELAQKQNQVSAAEGADKFAKETHQQGMEWSRKAAQEELEGIERNAAEVKKTHEEGMKATKEMADEELEQIARAAQARKKANEQDEAMRRTQLEQIEKQAQTEIRSEGERTQMAVSEAEKRGDLSGAKASSAGGFAAEQGLLQGLISAENGYQQAVSASNMEVEKKNELILASGKRQVELQDQITLALDRTQKEEQQISDKNPWKLMQSEMTRATQVVQLQTGAFQNFTATLNSGVGGAIEGWITGTEKFGQAIEKTFVHILASEASFVVQWLLKKAELWALDAIVGKTSQTTAALGSITANSAVAATGAAASVAAIPLVGWMMAPQVAAETFATTIAWASMLAMEAGGIVPRTGIIMAHEGEGVMPRNLTEMLTSAADSGRGGGDTHIHNHINAVDGASVQRMIDNNRHLFTAAGASHFRRSR
jgi:hypothetical protein